MSLPPVAPRGVGLQKPVTSAAEAEPVAVASSASDDAAPQTPSVVDKARTAAAANQGGLAPLFADLAQARALPGATFALKNAIAQMLALPLPVDAELSGPAVQAAVARSGLFLEARLAAGEAPGEAAPDLKAALITLQKLLKAPGGEAASAPGGAVPRPPSRDAALAGQGPAAATLPDAGAAAMARHLGPEVDQALSRLTLHQLASLPQGEAPAWMFELPLQTAQGTAIAQFAVDRDGEASGGSESPETWRARFSLQIEPLGEVHVHLAIEGGRTRVSVWAERNEGVEALRAAAAELAGALSGEVRVRAGKPKRPTPAPGAFLDQPV